MGEQLSLGISYSTEELRYYQDCLECGVHEMLQDDGRCDVCRGPRKATWDALADLRFAARQAQSAAESGTGDWSAVSHADRAVLDAERGLLELRCSTVTRMAFERYCASALGRKNKSIDAQEQRR